MIYVQITTPILPKKATEIKLIDHIKKIVKDPKCKVQFFKAGRDFYGQLNFDIMVMDEENREKIAIRNEVMKAVFTTLFN